MDEKSREMAKFDNNSDMVRKFSYKGNNYITYPPNKTGEIGVGGGGRGKASNFIFLLLIHNTIK